MSPLEVKLSFEFVVFFVECSASGKNRNSHSVPPKICVSLEDEAFFLADPELPP
jgi:hypothetical protein